MFGGRLKKKRRLLLFRKVGFLSFFDPTRTTYYDTKPTTPNSTCCWLTLPACLPNLIVPATSTKQCNTDHPDKIYLDFRAIFVFHFDDLKRLIRCTHAQHTWGPIRTCSISNRETGTGRSTSTPSSHRSPSSATHRRFVPAWTIVFGRWVAMLAAVPS